MDLTKLEGSQIEIDLTLKPEVIDFGSEFVTAGREIGFKGKLDNQPFWAIVKGDISAIVEIACSRCLEKVETPFDIEIETAFITAENYNEKNEVELDVQGFDVSIFEGKKIDLAEVVREQILLAVPAQLLCNKDCKGLCQECGTNKNLKSCRCDLTNIDSRWSALESLKKFNDE